MFGSAPLASEGFGVLADGFRVGGGGGVGGAGAKLADHKKWQRQKKGKKKKKRRYFFLDFTLNYASVARETDASGAIGMSFS